MFGPENPKKKRKKSKTLDPIPGYQIRICILIGSPDVSYTHGSSVLYGGWGAGGGGWGMDYHVWLCRLHTAQRCLAEGQVRAESQSGLHLPSCVPELSTQKGCLLKKCMPSFRVGWRWEWGRWGLGCHICRVPSSPLYSLLVPNSFSLTTAI